MDVSKMRKVAILGKANSGKNTTANLIAKALCKSELEYKIMAFADPIKEMVLEMFPWADHQCLYGSSKWRSKLLTTDAGKGKSLVSYRQVLIDLGSQARAYNENHWINVFDFLVRIHPITSDYRNDSHIDYNLIIVPDARYRNEFDYLRANGYFMIKIFRDSDAPIINHSSETNQDQIKNEEFDFIIDNNGTLERLQENIKTIVENIRKSQPYG